jgi:hypothetical protein
VGVDDDPALVGREARRLREPGAGLRAAGQQDQVGLAEPLDQLTELERDAEVLEPALDAAAGLGAEPGGVADVFVGLERDAHAAHGQRSGGLAADEA